MYQIPKIVAKDHLIIMKIFCLYPALKIVCDTSDGTKQIRIRALHSIDLLEMKNGNAQMMKFNNFSGSPLFKFTQVVHIIFFAVVLWENSPSVLNVNPILQQYTGNYNN